MRITYVMHPHGDFLQNILELGIAQHFVHRI